MAYDKVWANNEQLNKVEKKKLKKDGLEILKDIPRFAEGGFDSIPQEEWELMKWAGLYLQKPKEDGFFMMRVKIPSGVLTGDQAETLAGISRDYGRDVFDVTTRQCVQFHWLTIEQMPDIFERLDRVGMTTVGACGDIARNIVGNPLAGIDPDELIDTRPIVEEMHNFFYKNDEFSNLPRKYKISISANIHNVSHAEINCLSFVPAKRRIGGQEVAGFHVMVGGGLSTEPHLGRELGVFVKPERVTEVAAAVTGIFRDYGYRKSRRRARLKYLVADWGAEKFTEKLQELTGPLPAGGETQFQGWNAGYVYGVHEQKQGGLSYVGFNVPVGRLDSAEVFELARIAGEYGNGEIRTCNSQNLVIPNIPNERVAALLAEPIFSRLSIDPKTFVGYSLSCTGIEYCNLAVVETKERMRTIAEYLDREVTLDEPLRIHMVGCPNSCAQRQIADIGLQGVKVRRQDKTMVDAFQIYVGGTLEGGGQFNRQLKGRVEADHLPSVLKGFIRHYKANKKRQEDFYGFVSRVGTDALQRVLDDILGKTAA